MRGHPRAKTPVFAPGVKPWNNWDAAGSREKWEGPLGKWEIGKSILGKMGSGEIGKRGPTARGGSREQGATGRPAGRHLPIGFAHRAHRVGNSGRGAKRLRVFLLRPHPPAQRTVGRSVRSSAQSGSSGLVRVFERIYFGQLEGSSGTFGTKNSYPGRLSRQRKPGLGGCVR